MGKRHSERLARHHTKGMLNFSGTERIFAKRVFERLQRRLEPDEKPQVKYGDVRAKAVASLSKWFIDRIDNALYKALIAGDKRPISLHSAATPELPEGPPEGRNDV